MACNRPSLKSYREQAYHYQKGRCFYCLQPMWLSDPKEFSERYGLSLPQVNFMRCTGEHLTAHSEGGAVSQRNIVAACWFCNSHRHRQKVPLPPHQYRDLVRPRLRRGKWHGLIPTYDRTRPAAHFKDSRSLMRDR